MGQVTYQFGQRLADAMGWTYKTERTLVGDIRRVTWQPKAGQRHVKTGEFWPEVEALPSKLTLSQGMARITLYIDGEVGNVRIDAVGVSGEPSPLMWVAMSKLGSPELLEAVKEKDRWQRENPGYSPKPPRKKTGRSKLNPSQLEVG